MKALFAMLLILSPLFALGQTEHNFKLGPKNTNCHTLPSTFATTDQALSAIASAKFRFQQTVKISRFRSPHSAIFYSCDGEKGYLIATESNDVRVIYPNIPVKVWDNFINASNPIDFYAAKIKGEYEKVNGD